MIPKAILAASGLLLMSMFSGASAQEDGCTETNPCPLTVDMDGNGISSGVDDDPSWNVTVGDWYQIDFFNADEESHTVTLTATGASWTIAGIDGVTTDRFPFDTVGEFQFQDSPSGDTAPIHVLASDAVAAEEGEEEGVTDPTEPGDGEADGDTDDVGAPGLSLVLLAAGLVGIVAVLRRKT